MGRFLRLWLWVTLGVLSAIGALPLADAVDPDSGNPFPIAINSSGSPVNDGEQIFPEKIKRDKRTG